MSISNNTANTICFYGESRTGKTREVGTMARHYFEKTGLQTRLIFCDGGGWEAIQPEIDAGLIIPLRLTGHPDFWNWMIALSRGFWPIDNSLNGKLISPSLHQQSSEIGLYVIEGIAAVCQEALNWMVRKKIKVSSDVVGYQQIKPTETHDDALQIEIGAPSESHYGNVMNFIFDVMRGFQRVSLQIPSVQTVLWTSLEAGGEEKIAGMKRSIIGVGAIGKAITPGLPAKFGDLLHFEREVDAKTRKVEYRAYFTPHEDRELGGRTWPASMRFPSTVSDALSKHPDFKKGYMILTDEDGKLDRVGVSQIFRWRDQESRRAAKGLRELMEEKRRQEREKLEKEMKGGENNA